MALFDFELRDVGEIPPWETSAGPSLSWFALSDGYFRMPLGNEVLFEYTEAVQRKLKMKDSRADYQIASIARDMLECVAPALAKLPPRIERLASDWSRLCELQTATEAMEKDDDWDLAYDAWRWLGERSPWTSYFASNPRLSFVRVENQVRIHWDNRGLEIEELPAWTAQKGMHALPVDVFVDECRSFYKRLLAQMSNRIDSIESGAAKVQTPVDIASLREQHTSWEAEFEAHFAERKPDLPWERSERALCAVAKKVSFGGF